MRALCESLTDEGFATRGSTSRPRRLTRSGTASSTCCSADLMMPGMDGIDVLRQALEIDPNLVGIIMTGQGTIPTAVEAMKAGAFDYVLKPFRLQTMLPVLDRAMERPPAQDGERPPAAVPRAAHLRVAARTAWSAPRRRCARWSA